MNIIKSNRLIAEFMGLELLNSPSWQEYYITRTSTSGYITHKLEYHTNWQRLMPVVEKIESSYHCEIDIFGNCVELSTLPDEKLIIETVGQSKIDAVYKSVVEFLEKYYDYTKL